MQIFFTNSNTIDLDSEVFKHYQSLLSYDERARMEGISLPKIKKNFVCGRGLIKTTLAKMLFCKAEDVTLKATSNGRLEIDHPFSSLSFNISHSNNFILMGVCDQIIGVDIEYVKDRNFLEIAKYFFSKKEFEILKNIDCDKKRREIFYYYWTIKEAFIKCNGEKLFDKLHDIECVIDANTKSVSHNFEQKYQVSTIHVAENYIASIVVRSS